MVSALVVVLGMGVFQLGLVVHVRNTLIAAAAEGARLGARADAAPGEAAARTRAFISDALPDAYAGEVTSARIRTAEGVAVVEVTVVSPIPVIGLIGPTGTMTVTGRAFDERQVASP